MKTVFFSIFWKIAAKYKVSHGGMRKVSTCMVVREGVHLQSS
jgi:hypothetical protein